MLDKLTKKRYLLLICFFISLFFLTPDTYAQSFKSLAGLDFLTTAPIEGSLPGFLNTMYRIVVSVAAVLAVIAIFYAGFIYTTSTSSDGKSSAKRRIQAALGGLLLAVGSYIILNTINPQLVKINLGIENLDSNQLSFNVLTAEQIQNIAEQQRVLTEETSNFYIAANESGLSSGGQIIQPLWDGGREFSPGPSYVEPGESTRGIPLFGESNPTAAPFGAPIETLTQSIVGPDGTLWARGKGSWFGGVNDHCVQPEPYPIGSAINSSESCWGNTRKTNTETTSLYQNIKLKTINTDQNYVAIRWNYDEKSAPELRGQCIEVYSAATGKTATGGALDWGPHPKNTDKSIDLSPGFFKALGYDMRPNGEPAGGTGDMFYFRNVQGNCTISQ